MFGGSGNPSSSQPGAPDDDSSSTAAAAAPRTPEKGSSSSSSGATLLFSPPRPTKMSVASASAFPLPASALDGGSEVCRALVSVYMQASGSSMQLKQEEAVMLLVKDAPFTYRFCLVTKERVILNQLMVPALTFFFKQSRHTFICNMTIAGHVHALVCCFARDEEEEEMREFFNTAYLETATHTDVKQKMKEEDRVWAMRASDDWDMVSEEDEEDEEMEYKKESSHLNMDDFPESSNIRVGGSAAKGSAPASSSSSSGERNDQLAVGMLLNRTFVNRGSQIGVFKHDRDGNLAYLNNVPVVRDMSGQAFSPTKMMLTEQDNKMLLLNSTNKGLVYEFDLEVGKVVQEYNAGESIPEIRTINPSTKYAERTGEQVVAGASKNAVFTLDPRQQGKNKLAENKVYKTVPKFNSLATTNDGCVAVGADDGQIRLYDSVSKIAKTALPGLGDAVTGIDVTADGSYVLATTNHYLLVIPTSVKDQDKNGFHKSITSKADAPIKLQLDPADMVKYNIQQLRFTPAKFDLGEDKEQLISTSTGPFIITWNFNKIKKGQRFHYKIKRCDSDVVADQFVYDMSQLAVTLPHNLFMQTVNKRK